MDSALHSRPSRSQMVVQCSSTWFTVFPATHFDGPGSREPEDSSLCILRARKGR